jgi:hypothetical protein
LNRSLQSKARTTSGNLHGRDQTPSSPPWFGAAFARAALPLRKPTLSFNNQRLHPAHEPGHRVCGPRCRLRGILECQRRGEIVNFNCSTIVVLAMAVAVIAIAPGCSSNSSQPETDGGSPEAARPAIDGQSDDSCSATAKQGSLQGNLAGPTCEYLGIRYGAPPVGALRFMAPQPAGCWQGTLDASEFDNVCEHPRGLQVTTAAELAQAAEQQFGDRAARVIARYPATDATASDVYIQTVTDFAFRCPTRDLARLTTAHGTEHFYLYSFDFGRAYHTEELGALFPTLTYDLGGTPPTAALATTMTAYWTQMAATGTPNGPSTPVLWPSYAAGSDEHLVLDDPPSAGSHLAESNCDFWDNLNGFAPP